MRECVAPSCLFSHPQRGCNSSEPTSGAMIVSHCPFFLFIIAILFIFISTCFIRLNFSFTPGRLASLPALYSLFAEQPFQLQEHHPQFCLHSLHLWISTAPIDPLQISQKQYRTNAALWLSLSLSIPDLKPCLLQLRTQQRSLSLLQ